MTIEGLYVIIGACMLLGALTVWCALHYTFKKQKNIDLVQGRLQDNTDDDIYDAIQRLKRTNHTPTKNREVHDEKKT